MKNPGLPLNEQERRERLDNWEHLPASSLPAGSWLRVTAEKREANLREIEEEYGPQDPLKNYPPKWWDKRKDETEE